MRRPVTRRRLRAERDHALQAYRGLASAWNVLTESDLSARQIAANVDEGGVNIAALLGTPGVDNPATRLIATLLWTVILGETGDVAEPPNYRSIDLAFTEAGETIEATLEVRKPGGASSHALRRRAEADRDLLAAICQHLRVGVTHEGRILADGAQTGMSVSGEHLNRLIPLLARHT